MLHSCKSNKTLEKAMATKDRQHDYDFFLEGTVK